MESTEINETKRPGRRVSKRPGRRVFEILAPVGLYVIVATFDYLLSFNKINFFHPFRRGFFCQDNDLMYPFKEISIGGGYVALISILPTVLIISVTEFVRNRRKFRTKLYLHQCYRIIGPLMLGLSFCTLFYEVTKSCVGSLRPYFFSVCQPTLNVTNCTDPHRYIIHYDCTTSNEDRLIDARKSFPSGHASISWYGMSFLVIYIHLRVSRHRRKMRPFCALLQTLALCVATYVGVSRIQDNAHRSIDIFAGAVIGIFFALITVSLTSAFSDDIKVAEIAKRDKPESLIVVNEP